MSINISKKKVAILLATYNGELYLREQLDSLFSQTNKEWTLYIHDDGSNDGTLSIINDYASKYNNIVVLPFQGGCGAKESFLRMLYEVDADYYFFCDQDDVWNHEKIEISLRIMHKLEMDNGENKPILVHSDLQVVDANLNEIDGSFWHMMLIRPDKLRTFNQIGSNCLVTGCTMLFNRRAKSLTKYPAISAVMHDVWVTLCVAKYNGIIYGIETPLIKYRQHGGNTVGAKDMKEKSRFLNRVCNLRSILEENFATYKMLRELNYGSVAKYIYYKLCYRFQ